MKKMVNGVLFDMTVEEIAQRDAEIAQDAARYKGPDVVTMAQARKALILSGVSITAVNAAIAAIPDATQRQLAETDWEYATTMRRQSPLVTSLAPVLGLTDEEIDDLFVLAATL